MVGIMTYGVYVPRFRIKADEIARMWGRDPNDIKKGLGVFEKSVPDMDEDCVTIAVEAARHALGRIDIDPCEIGAIYVGSESHPYAVKPTATVLSEAICASPNLTAADFEFACKAGTAAIQACIGLVASKRIKYGLAVGADTSQAAPGNALEYATGAGGAAYLIGDGEDVMVDIEDTFSFTTDTPDFWRREGMNYPEHGGRFTGEPAYFKHVISATQGLLDKVGARPEDYDYAVFHQPNGKFPLRVSKMLGFTKEQIEPSLMIRKIGNTYSAATLIGLAAVLDQASPGSRILVTSFGSGAGGDSFSMRVTDVIEKYRDRVPTIEKIIENPKYIDYGMYVKHNKKLQM
ncbi:MAG: hydroxymethylglutaryl-CoA synthase [Halobacteriota archaeon]|nr:hydroxymethylglutaryl-CoA synthase [Halobacteriota archaeon]